MLIFSSFGFLIYVLGFTDLKQERGGKDCLALSFLSWDDSVTAGQIF